METADLGHHISRRFNEDLERVRSKVLAMGGFVEQQLQKAVTALVEGVQRREVDPLSAVGAVVKAVTEGQPG